ncbi:MAG: lytic transglycosylase F, partial [Gammaproteobacteria bacterium]|nr:lytic transglycosylase F [Gammaproteobacteria bacterium]
MPANLEGGRYLPRKGSPVRTQQEAAVNFAESLGLTPRVVPVTAFEDMIPMLLKGKGDLIAANLTVTDERKLLISFSIPLTHVREQIITRADDTKLKSIKDLSGRTVTLDPASSFWKTVEKLRKKHPDIQINLVKNLRTDDVMDDVADGRLDLTVQDSNVIEMYLGFRDDLRVAFDISKDRPIAWGLRPDAIQLRDALNRFLHQEQWTRTREVSYLDDLPGIKERKTLRVLLRNNAATYFLWKGQLLGFEYDLAKEFAKRIGVRLEVVVPPRHADLLSWLKEGKGDIASGFLPVTERHKASGIEFSRPYHYTSEIVVSRTGEQQIRTPEALSGRTIAVRRSSSYWHTLEKLRASGIALQLRTAPENMETEEIIAKVANGEYNLTIADSHILDIELTWRNDIQAAFSLGDKIPHAWAVRPSNTALLAAINQFFNQEYRGLFYNVTYEKYFENPRTILSHVNQRLNSQEEIALSPYDELARRYADKYGFDWRLIISQMYQESRFNPEAESW